MPGSDVGPTNLGRSGMPQIGGACAPQPGYDGILHRTDTGRFPADGGSDTSMDYFATGIVNSAPFSVLSGQRCMIDFCFV